MGSPGGASEGVLGSWEDCREQESGSNQKNHSAELCLDHLLWSHRVKRCFQSLSAGLICWMEVDTEAVGWTEISEEDSV